MAGVLDGVDQRTRLAGENRMELLLFTLSGKQKFGINVFKVQEVIHCPGLTRIANGDPVVVGITNIRGKTITVIDLAMAIGDKPIENVESGYVIVSEFNRHVQGFLVNSVDRIVNMKWADIKAPPKGLGRNNFMTAVTEVDEELVEIIDVEKVLSRMIEISTDIDKSISQVEQATDKPIKVLVVDDSSVARNQIKRTLQQMGIEPVLAINGRDGLNKLKEMVADGQAITDVIDVVISDIEMPEMDGYTLTMEIKKHELLKSVPVILHTSLTGQFNSKMVEQVGANSFVPKFHAETLAEEVRSLIKK
ncbi:MAG: chemotaxis protein [Gammaproteobacteria bacterium]|nr:chemotaxis protein [Gammaproteobacteria bacterium]